MKDLSLKHKILYAVTGVFLVAAVAIVGIGSAYGMSVSDMVQKVSSGFGLTAQASDGSTETANSGDINAEMAAAFFKTIKEAPDINSALVTSEMDEYGPKLGYAKVGDKYIVPRNFELLNRDLNNPSHPSMDAERSSWAVNEGLVVNGITDAPRKPFALTTEQKSKVLSLGLNQFADMSAEEKENLELQLIRALMEDPILLEGYMRLFAEQQIGQEGKIGDHWLLWQQFCQQDLNSFTYTAEDGKYYTGSNNYHKYVVGFVSLLRAMDGEVARFTANEGDHLFLNVWEFGTDRRLQKADYKEDLPSYVFLFRLKNGKIALMFGSNLIDKRPEVLNYTTMTQEVAVTSAPVVKKRSSGGGGGGSSTPSTPTPIPNNPPPTPGGGETKNPSDDAANAITDWNDDDPGPGPWKPDQGNSKSPTVDGSQAKPNRNRVVNTDGGNSNLYPVGPSADNTDNGNTPDTSKPENQPGNGDGVNRSSVNGGTGDTTNGSNSGRVNVAPPVD